MPSTRGVGIAGTTLAHGLLLGAAIFAAHRAAPSDKIVYEVKLVAAPRPTLGPATPVTTTPPPEKHAPAPVKRAPVKAPPARKPPPPAKHAAEPVPSARTPVTPLPDVAPSTGADVVTLQQDGIKFPFPEYLRKIADEVYRRWNQSGFKPGLHAQVAFVIMQDGTVPDSSIRVETSSRNIVFDSRGTAAIETAGVQHAFGPLPTGFNSASLPVLFNFTMIPKGGP